jgi:hypothetical protein
MQSTIWLRGLIDSTKLTCPCLGRPNARNSRHGTTTKVEPCKQAKTLGKPSCKLRLRDITASTNHTSKIKRLEEKLRHHDKAFVFSSDYSVLSLDEARAQFNKATKTLRKIQLDADGYRISSLYDLLAMHKSGSSPYSSEEDRRHASIVRKTIQTEACRGFFGHLRSQLKPTEVSPTSTFLSMTRTRSVHITNIYKHRRIP